MMKNQSGSVLSISLILLTAITLIAMMGMQRSGLQTKIVNNIQLKQKIQVCTKSITADIFKIFSVSNTQLLNDAIDAQFHYRYATEVLKTPPSEVPSPNQVVDFDLVICPHVSQESTVRYRDNGNDLGNPNASSIRENFSRGKNGSGTFKYETVSAATLTNAMASTQVVGMEHFSPDQ